MVRKFFLFGFIALAVIGAAFALYGKNLGAFFPGAVCLALVVGGVILLLKKG